MKCIVRVTESDKELHIQRQREIKSQRPPLAMGGSYWANLKLDILREAFLCFDSELGHRVAVNEYFFPWITICCNIGNKWPRTEKMVT